MSRKISVRLLFGESIIERNGKPHVREIEVASDGSDSILSVKQRLAVRGSKTASARQQTSGKSDSENAAPVTHARRSLCLTGSLWRQGDQR